VEDKGQSLTTLLLVSTIFAGGFMAYSYFVSEPPQAAPSDPNPDTQQEAAPESEEDEPEPGTDAQQGDGDTAQDTMESAPEPVDPAQRLAQERLATIEGQGFIAKFSNLSAAATSVKLTADRYLTDGQPMQVVTTEREKWLPLRMELDGVTIPPDAIWEMEQLSTAAARFTYRAGDTLIVRKIEAGQGPYQLWSTLRIENRGSRTHRVRAKFTTHHYVRREDEEGGFVFATRSPAISSGICMWGEDEVNRLPRDEAHPTEEGKPAIGFGPNVAFTGVENTYFANVMATVGEHAERCQITNTDRYLNGEEHGTLFEARLIYPTQVLAPGESTTVQTLAYIGPKDTAALRAAGHHLTKVVDLGWFSAVAEWLVALLGLIYGFIGNWGVAIIAMTVLVRIVMFPLTWKSFQSMARMRVLKPEMDALNERFKDDREAKGAAMMELYRKHKINPLGGCLPQLLQMPVWFAFYASLSTNVELYRANFALYWTDLSAPDPYFVLPVALGLLMFLQQKITPTTMDPMQAKMMMYFMPIMITSFMLFLPAGLCLYMVTNSVLGISQQQWIHRSLNKEAAEKERAEQEKTEGEPGDDGSDEDEDGTALAVAATGPSSVVSRTKLKPRSKKKRRTRRARS